LDRLPEDRSATLTPEELRGRRWQALMYKGEADGLASVNPAYELLTALKAAKLRAIGPDHNELPPEFWDDQSFDPETWPNVRFRREDMLRLWPDVETLRSTAAKAPEVYADAPHDKLVGFYRDGFGTPGAATNAGDMDRAAEEHFGGRIRVKARRAARNEAGVKGKVGRPRKSGK
jgi:hypothetical protein